MTAPAISPDKLAKLDRPVGVQQLLTSEGGFWQLVIRPYGLTPVTLGTFRGAPITINNFSWDDPFGPTQLAFTIPTVSAFEKPGAGELYFLAKDTPVDLDYVGPLPPGYPDGAFRWEGYIASFSWDDGLSVQCPGALRQVDNYLAKPEYLSRPLPYEWAIARQLMNKPDLQTTPLRMEWPTWWAVRYSDPPAGTPSYLIPSGVKSGDNWTAMLTRSTGTWDQLLTSYIQGLITAMYTERGRFTIDLAPGRAPVLRHRDIITDFDAPNVVVIDPASPGVKVSMAEDWTQSANVAYGQGTSLSGVGYTGMQVTPDGSSTYYLPLAAARQVEPASDANGWFQRSRMRREVLMQMQAGLDEDQAIRAATSHLARFGDPGVTGSITLTSVDPLFNGVPLSRALIKAGMPVQIKRLLGSPDGIMALITKSNYDFEQEAATLTFDTRWRDQLTVDEVRTRGRDALQVPRMLVAGGYTPPVSDMLLPWNYATGSGCLPSGPEFNSLRVFQQMPVTSRFPWTDVTTKCPPKNPSWRSCYAHIGPASSNADKNWATLATGFALPIKVAQAGQIRLLQMAAYDENGNVFPVDFHVSFWYASGANASSTPMLTSAQAPNFPPYQAGQHYPFFPGGWEKYNVDGTLVNGPNNPDQTTTAGLIRAYGSSYEKAGHYPGSFAAHDPSTGLLVDEASWSFDTTHFDNTFDPYSAASNASNPLAGQIYMLIYCDAQLSKDVYFLGRLFRVEPGTGV